MTAAKAVSLPEKKEFSKEELFHIANDTLPKLRAMQKKQNMLTAFAHVLHNGEVIMRNDSCFGAHHACFDEALEIGAAYWISYTSGLYKNYIAHNHGAGLSSSTRNFDAERPLVLKYMSWVLNDSPMADVFITKDPAKAFDEGIIYDTQYPILALITGGIMTRYCTETVRLMEDWERLSEIVGPDAAFFLTHFFQYRPKDKEWVYFRYRTGHSLFNSAGKEEFTRWMLRNRDLWGKPASKEPFGYTFFNEIMGTRRSADEERHDSKNYFTVSDFLTRTPPVTSSDGWIVKHELFSIPDKNAAETFPKIISANMIELPVKKAKKAKDGSKQA